MPALLFNFNPTELHGQIFCLMNGMHKWANLIKMELIKVFPHSNFKKISRN